MGSLASFVRLKTHICVCVYPSLLLDTYREQGQALASVTELDQDRGADLSQSLS